MDLQEEEGINIYAKNNDILLQRFYQDNIGWVYRYIYSKVGNQQETEDLVSQIFIKAVHGIDILRPSLSTQKWLFHIVQTTMADYWRAYYRIPTHSLEALLDGGWEGPVEEYGKKVESTFQLQLSKRVHDLLQALPENYREVLRCRFLLNLSVKETAQHMGLKETHVKVLQFRALKRAADIDKILIDKMRDDTKLNK